jgi:multicomponent Na+:H+ antiporter subunit D
MMDVVAPLLIALPITGAALALLLNRYPGAQKVLGAGILTAMLALSGFAVAAVADGTVEAVRMGGRDARIGIVLAVDPLAALMLVVSTLTLLGVFVYAMGSPRTRDQGPYFYPIYLVLAAGVAASFLTADLFNLFVAFEIMLTASYVLITLGGSREQVRHGTTYVVISLLASTLFITTVGLIYAATGTVNIADLAVRLDGIDPAVRSALGLLLLVVFGVKAAIFPVFQWLPDSYPTAPSPVTAVFAGLLTKIGVYAIIRTQTLMFPTIDGRTSRCCS